jgi:hypothetical protein
MVAIWPRNVTGWLVLAVGFSNFMVFFQIDRSSRQSNEPPRADQA